MLVLDSNIGCIEADESQVLVLYRSAAIVMSPAPGSRPASMEGYICAIQAKSQTKVHLALVADNRKIYVYQEAFKATDAAGIETSINQAVSCAKAMGFAPEAVDLNYRPAMREVVLRNIKILRSPGSKGASSLRAGLPGAPILPVPSSAGTAPDKAPHLPPKTIPAAAAISSPPPLPPAGASAPAAAAAAGSPPASRIERSSVGLLQLEKELQLMGAERDALLAQLQQLSVVHQDVLMELTVQREEAARVAAEMGRLASVEEELKGAVAVGESLKSEVRDLTEKLQQSERGTEERTGENRRLTAELAAAKKAGKALLAECEALRKKAALAAEAEKIAEENRVLRDELDELNSVREAELGRMSSLEQDLVTLAAELGTATADAAAVRGELATAVAGAATAEAELVVARSKVVAAEATVAAMSRKIHATELEPDKPRSELAAAVREQPAPDHRPRQNQEDGGTVARTAPVTEAASLPKQQTVAKQAPVQEISQPEPAPSLGDELDAAFAGLQKAPFAASSKEESATCNSPAPVDLPPVEEIGSEAGSWYGADVLQLMPVFPEVDMAGAEQERAQVQGPAPQQAHDFPPFGELQDSFFSSTADPASAGLFVLRPDLDVIEYLAAEDVVELHQSINNANMSPDGKGQESCRGYICSLKCGEKMQVFAAIYGTRSGRTSVYTPERQPEDEAGYTGVMRSAISFAEEVGLMMEPVQGGAAAVQVDSIVNCPVLKKAA